ncbi:MAG: response regulator [Chlorobiaceae bacterium]|nr:response regulator [Chlorobiaceae bacterium]
MSENLHASFLTDLQISTPGILPETVFVMNREGKLLDAEGVFRDDLPAGRSKPLPGEKHPDEIVDIETRKRVAAEVIRTAQPKHFDTVQDGFVLSNTIQPLFSSGGSITHLLLSVRTKTEGQESGQSVTNSLAAITGMYDAIPASVIIVDARMKLVGWNRFSRESINGLNEAEMPGINPLKRVHPDDLPEIRRKVHNILHHDAEESGEFRMFHKNGPPYKWAMFRGKRAIIDNTPCVVCVVTEITELKEAEEQQKKLQEQLFQYQKMELIGQLAGGIAHDFNNALAAIIGNTELVLGKLDPDNPAVSNIRDIHTLARRSADMTRQLLTFARKQIAMPKVFNLVEAVSECLGLHCRLLDEKIRIEWTPCPEQLLLKLDPTQLEQILSNLIINARDAITDNGCIRVECCAEQLGPNDSDDRCSGLSPGEYVKLSVSDNGSGIEPAVLPHIFEPFFTTKEVGKGTGLGLSTVYGIVMQNSGCVECRSEPGKGTTFDVWLPRHQEPEEEQPEAPAGEPEELVVQSKGTIMVVEDEPYILKLIQDILESHDFTVFTAQDAEECLGIADKQRTGINLLVTDVVLPTMNGIELSQALQQRNPELKCLFMSAHAPENVIRQKRLSNETDFIQKPFAINDFIRAIDRVMNTGLETM